MGTSTLWLFRGVAFIEATVQTQTHPTDYGAGMHSLYNFGCGRVRTGEGMGKKWGGGAIRLPWPWTGWAECSALWLLPYHLLPSFRQSIDGFLYTWIKPTLCHGFIADGTKTQLCCLLILLIMNSTVFCFIFYYHRKIELQLTLKNA